MRNKRLSLAKLSNAADAFFAQTFSPWTDIVAVSILAASAWQMGLLNALTTAAFLVLGIPIGIFVDRFDGVRVLKSALAAKVILTLALLTVSLTGHLSIPVLLVFATLMGTVTVATETAQVSTVPALSRSHAETGTAIANITAWDRIATLAGPVSVGFGIAYVGQNLVLGAGIAFAALATVLAMLIRRPQQETARAAQERAEKYYFWRQVTDGWRVLAADRQLVGMTWLSSLSNTGLALGSAVEAIVIIQVLDLGVEFFGLLGSIAAIAGIAAAFLANKISRIVPVRRLYLWGGIGQFLAGALPIAAYLMPSAAVWLLVIHAAMWSVILTITNVASSIYAAVTVSQELLGRVAAFRRTLTMGLVPIASIIGGVLGSVVGIWLPLGLWPAFALLGVGAYALLDPGATKGAPPA